MPLALQIYLIAILAIVLIPAAIRLGWLFGENVYPLARDLYDDARGFADETTEAWLLRSEGSFA